MGLKWYNRKCIWKRFYFVRLAGRDSTNVAETLSRGTGMTLHVLPVSDVPLASSRFPRVAFFFLFFGSHLYAPMRALGGSETQIREALAAIGDHHCAFMLIGPPGSLATISPSLSESWYGRMEPGRVSVELTDAMRCIQANHIWCSAADLATVFSGATGFTSGEPSRSRSHSDAAHNTNSAPPSHEAANATPPLTRRQREVATLVAQGASNTQIATQLCISVATVKTHVSAAMLAFSVSNRTALALRMRSAS